METEHDDFMPARTLDKKALKANFLNTTKLRFSIKTTKEILYTLRLVGTL